eukprot:SAG11_NODE_910_length_6585_cov_7.205520_6_plen_103_part_00
MAAIVLFRTPGEKRFVVLAIMIGAFLYAYVIGDFSNLLANLSKDRSDFDDKMRSVNDLMTFINVPSQARQRVQNYYDYQYNNKSGKEEIISELPISLQVCSI